MRIFNLRVGVIFFLNTNHVAIKLKIWTWNSEKFCGSLHSSVNLFKVKKHPCKLRIEAFAKRKATSSYPELLIQHIYTYLKKQKSS